MGAISLKTSGAASLGPLLEKLGLLVMSAVILGPQWVSPAWAVVCDPQEGDYRVDVVIDIPPVNLRRDRSRAELGTLAIHGPTYSVLGLTASSLEAGTQTYYNYRPLVEGGHCFWVDRVEVQLRYNTLDIYVASEYAPTSCPYKAILTHEEKHAKVARAHLAGYVQQIRSALSALSIPRPREPSLVESVTRAQQKTLANIEKLLQPVLKKLRETMEHAQEKIDSPEEYRRVQKQCTRW